MLLFVDLRTYEHMKNHPTLIFLLVIAGLLLAACRGSETPSLAVANQTTLAFIYTDG